jgi:hypothetical protein
MQTQGGVMMTDSKPQHGNGTTTERQRHGKIETTETINAGEIAQRERWPDIVSFAIDVGLLLEEQSYGWTVYTQLRCGSSGAGQGGEGWKETEYLIFQKKIGYNALRVLHELFDWPVPNSGNIADTTWRLNRCMHLVRKALTKAEDAAQEARDEINTRRSVSEFRPS